MQGEGIEKPRAAVRPYIWGLIALALAVFAVVLIAKPTGHDPVNAGMPRTDGAAGDSATPPQAPRQGAQ